MKMDEGYDRDMLLFDYLEGNLGAKEKLYVEGLLVEDPALREELKMWQETLITEDLPHELPLCRLYKPSISWNIPVISIILLLTIAFSSALIYPLKDSQEEFMETELEAGKGKSEVKQFSPASLSELPDRTENVQIQFKNKNKEFPIQSPGSIPVSKGVENDHEEPALDQEVPVKTDPEVTFHETFIPDSSISEIPVVAQPNKDTASVPEEGKSGSFARKKAIREEKKKLRKIAKLKRKALQLKEQQQFLKGNKPYVVPLDLQNF